MHTSVKTLKVSEFQEIACPLSLLHQQQLDLLPVVDNQGQVVDIITSESICQALAQEIEKTTNNYEQTEEQQRLLKSAVANATLAKNKWGNLHQCSEVVQDTTVFEALHDSEERFGITDMTSVPICMSDSDALGNFFKRQWSKYKWLVTRAIVRKDTTGKHPRLIGVSVNITSRVQAKQEQLRQSQEMLLQHCFISLGSYQAKQEQLRQSQEMLQLIMDTIPQCVFWKDTNFVFLGCNRNFVKVVGFDRPEDIVGKTDYNLPWKKEHSDFYRECDARVMQTNTPQYQRIEPLVRADGKQVWLKTNKVPLHDAEPTFVTENVVTMTGYEAQKFVESSHFWAANIHPEDTAQVFAKVSKRLEHGRYPIEYRFLHEDGIYRWIYDQSKVVRDETGNSVEIVGYWAGIQNVSNSLNKI